MISVSGLPFWQWYGTRFVWKTIGNDYCPFCQGEPIAGGLFLVHLLAGLEAASLAWNLTGNPFIAGFPAVAGLLGGSLAAHGFLAHLYGWQEDTHQAVEEIAEEYDADVVTIPSGETDGNES